MPNWLGVQVLPETKKEEKKKKKKKGEWAVELEGLKGMVLKAMAGEERKERRRSFSFSFVMKGADSKILLCFSS